jgi:acyl-coenzyme A thioesterase PaaI-like protein
MQEREDSPRHWCYGCGDRNAEGLQIVFEVDGKRVKGRFQARETHRGWPGLAHGGVAAAALDEAMGWATWAAGALSMTARMEVKYRRPLPLGEDLIVSAEVTRDRGRRLEVEAVIRTPSGEALVEATGLFLRVPPERARELDALFFAEPQADDSQSDEVPSRSS